MGHHGLTQKMRNMKVEELKFVRQGTHAGTGATPHLLNGHSPGEGERGVSEGEQVGESGGREGEGRASAMQILLCFTCQGAMAY